MSLNDYEDVREGALSVWFIGRLLTAMLPLSTETEDYRKCIVKSVLVLVSALGPRAALAKLNRIGRKTDGEVVTSSGEQCSLKYLGVQELSPIYEDLTDGCELLEEEDSEVSTSSLRCVIPSSDDLLSEIYEIERRRRTFGHPPMWQE